MGREQSELVIQSIQTEQNQLHATRAALFAGLEDKLKRPVVSFFTSFVHPVMMEDADADMLEGVLQKMDLSDGLALFISSPGGDGLAAERIMNVCRSYSGTGEYWAIVPGKAKSAATMVCLGASKIIMGATSELGAVDPQFAEMKDGRLRRFSVHNILKSYKSLFEKATGEKGNLQPYLQQLANYDSREIEEMEAACRLSEDIVVKALGSGMMGSLSPEEIREKILNRFILPTETKVHARPIYPKEAAECGLNVDLQDVRGDLWRDVYELYVRTDNFVKVHVAKCVESRGYSFVAPVPTAPVQGVERG